MVSEARFIAFEGGEGSGKSTQARLLAEALIVLGVDVVLTREPGGTPGAEAIRALLLDPPGEGWNPRAEALLFAAARSDHVERLIRPALARGQWVICDRFVDSSRAYQGGAGGLGDDSITALHQIGSLGLRADCTILIEVNASDAAQRVAARDGSSSDAIGGRSALYHAEVAETFRENAARDPEKTIVIDGNGTPAQVHQRVWERIAKLLPGSPA